ncbi:MAG TPA: VOC family protein [Solirubrobacterales bacterium]|jgi:predicted enzyme related to lactoylglutathione lyase|nr:VOC family protein [Solirubrobacterales bacterium]
MFTDSEATNSFAVDDLEKAKEFYGETLGIRAEVLDEANGLLSLKHGGGGDTLIYLKPDFVPATYTVLGFTVDDVDKAVDALTERGVEVERYEGFDQDEKGIARGNGPDIAWFKDPAGNILSVLSAP